MSIEVALKNYEIWRDDLRRDGASWYWKKHSFKEESELLLKQLDRFRSIESKPLSDTLDDYRSKMSMQELYDQLSLQVDEPLIERLLENSVGDPPTEKVISRSGRELRANINDLILISFAAKIFSSLTEKQKNSNILILEIGGGYGGLAAKLKTLLPLSRISIIDLPHAGLLQTFYLQSLFPKSRLIVAEYLRDNNDDTLEQRNTDFSILPTSMVECLKNQSFDLVINSRSFMEMDQKMIKDYFDLIQSRIVTGGLFFNCNRLWKNAGDRPTQIARYPYDDRWQLVSLSSSFFQNNTIELLTRRVLQPNPVFRSLVRGIPKTDYLIHNQKFRGLMEWIRPYFPPILTLTYWKRMRKFKK